MMRRLRSASGQATVEFAGTIWLVGLAALAAWQLALAGWSAVGAANAARTAAREYSRVSNATQAQQDATQSLQGDGLGAGSSVTVNANGITTVIVKVPLVFPGIPSPIKITESADMPSTG
jgi:hypothetical protein